MASMQFEQRVDVRKVGPNRWMLAVFVGRAVCFYAEAGAEQASFTVGNEFTLGDIGKWRGLGNRRHLIIGHGGTATVAPKEGGSPGEVQVSFQGVALAV